jgi:hypothetical protein
MNRQYIGARYVPKFADPVEWDNLRNYEALTIVTYAGTSYTSKKPVPVGTKLNNTDYWVETGNYNEQVEQYRKEVEIIKNEIVSIKNVYVTPEMYGAVGDGITDDSRAIQLAYNSGKRVISSSDAIYYIASTIYILSNNTLEIAGKLKLANNITGFIIGDSTHAVQNAKIIINECFCEDKTSILFSLRSCTYSTFDISYAHNLNKIIEINPSNSCGENIFYPHLWYNTNIAFHIMGASSWDKAEWAEGNQIISGFIAKSKYGIKIEPNVKYSGMLVTCGIDNTEVENSFDYCNNGAQSPQYAISNLLLFRFIRLENCIFKNLDSYWDANLGLHTTGSISCDYEINCGNDEEYTSINKGTIEMVNNTASFLDIKNEKNDDYILRLASINDEGEIGSKYGNGAKLNKNGFTVKACGTSSANDSEGVDVILPKEVNTNDYKIFISPTWETTYYITSKSTIGFHVKFGTSPNTSKNFDWFMLG